MSGTYEIIIGLCLNSEIEIFKRTEILIYEGGLRKLLTILCKCLISMKNFLLNENEYAFSSF